MHLYLWDAKHVNNVRSAGQQLEALELASRINLFLFLLEEKKNPNIENHIRHGESGTEGLKYTAKGLLLCCCS